MRKIGLLLALAFMSVTASVRAEDLWPSLSEPAKIAGGGEKDAAVIVGAENYLMVSKVAGARRNAEDWQSYLSGALKVPSEKVFLLRDNEATLEKMKRYASRAASQVEPGGRLWFVFIGHGAPSKDGDDGLLIGVDAQQDPDGLYARSLPRGELLSLLSKGKQTSTIVILDACFSGRSSSGEALVAGLQPLVLVRPAPIGDARTILMTAAKSDQFAGPLPKAGESRPAFSYLALGALRGWAADAKGIVTASAVVAFANKALALDKGRTQTPELTIGAPEAVLAKAKEPGPDFARIDRQSEAPAAVAEAPKLKSAAALGIQWIQIPAGSFMMGYEYSPRAKPVHAVTIKAFQLAKTTVTQKQYQACVDAGACTPTGEYCKDPFKGDNQPVVCVDWNQARTFAEWAGARLPTESEWEYAARGVGKNWDYPWGSEEPTCDHVVAKNCIPGTKSPGCSKPKGNTPQGVCDMLGNVYQWVMDSYQDSYAGAPTDGNPFTGPSQYRVKRGTGFMYAARAAHDHDGAGIDTTSDDIGFRLAR